MVTYTPRIQMRVDDTWTDIYPRQSAGMTWRHGRSDEQSAVGTGQLQATLDNRDGKFCPRNPVGAWYGQIGRNTPIRVGVTGAVRLMVDAESGAYISAPDSSSTSPVGDLDIRLDITAYEGWCPKGTRGIISKFGASNYSWLIGFLSGKLVLMYSADGTTTQTATCSVYIEEAMIRRCLRVTLDCSDGTNSVAAFYFADEITGPWHRIGDPVTGTIVASIYNSASSIRIGGSEYSTYATAFPGEYHRVQIRDGIAGSILVDLDMSTGIAGSSSISDGTDIWTLTGATELSDMEVAWSGEASEWPPTWDPTLADATVQVSAAGILRRLGQGAAVLGSPMRRGVTSLATPAVAYWPMEDGADAGAFGTPVSGARPMTIEGATSTTVLASYTDFKASDSLPVLGYARCFGWVPVFTPSSAGYSVRWVMYLPTATDTSCILQIRMESTSLCYIKILYRSTGVQFIAYSSSGATVVDSGLCSTSTLWGQKVFCSLSLEPSGSDVTITFAYFIEGASSGLYWSTTATSCTLGRVSQIVLDPTSIIASLTAGHVHVMNEVPSLFLLYQQFKAYLGETAARRVRRICEEEGIPLTYLGASGTSTTMGYQPIATALEILREAEAADGGVLSESPYWTGLWYRSLGATLNQSATVEVDWTDLSEVPSLPDDDQGIVNDVTLTRKNASSARAVATEGTLTSAQPPAGVGIYAATDTVNCEIDDDVANLAWWRVHLGTDEQPRVPQLAVRHARDVVALLLAADLRRVTPGQRLVLSGQPAGYPPDGLELLVQGASSRLDRYELVTDLVCARGTTHLVGKYGQTITFSDDFESGGLATWVTTSGAVTAVAAAAHSGSYGLRVAPAGAAAYVSTSTTKWSQIYPWATGGFRFKFSTLPFAGAGAWIATIQNVVGSGHFDISLSTSHTIVIDFVSGASELDTGVTADTAWHYLEWRVYYGDVTWWAAIRLDGGDTEYEVTRTGGSATCVKALILGTTSTSYTYTLDVDGVWCVVDAIDRGWGVDHSRYDSDTSTLAAGVTSTATSLSVAYTGQRWTVTENAFPLDIMVSGERMRVTGISGTSSPQAFTVERSINGVVKAQVSGAAVRLCRPARYSPI